MTHKARVSFNLTRDQVEVELIDRRDVGVGSVFTAAYAFQVPLMELATPGEAPKAEPLLLPEDAARAIYEALGQYFGNSPDNPTELRRDYLAERARVDKLIDGVLVVATAPQLVAGS